MFHGDIKPANIFYGGFYDDLIMTTDIGSLLYLGEPNENGEEPPLFLATSFTENFASPEFCEAVKN